MATPRKNWFKVPDSIAFDNLTNDELAGLIRLQGYMNARWARDGRKENERGRADLDSRLMMMITGKRRADVAAKSIERLANIGEMFIQHNADTIEIFWPNYAIFQESDSRKLPSPRLLQEQEQEQEEEGEKEAPPAPVADATPRAPRRVLIEKPENFPDDSKVRLREWAGRKGFDRDLLNAGLDTFRDWVPVKPPYRRTIEQWEGAFKKILREGVVDGKIGRSDAKTRPAYRRDESGQVLVPNEWRGLAG